jgi:hypothetical protein
MMWRSSRNRGEEVLVDRGLPVVVGQRRDPVGRGDVGDDHVLSRQPFRQ